MNKYKIGIIGLGRMGITHLSLLNSNPKVEITSACDSSKVMNNIFSKYLENIKIYEDYQKILNNEKLDAIIVSTPPSIHSEIVKYAINKEINIFIEKPFTLSYHESSMLSKMAKEKGIINQVGYVNRFNDMFLKAKTFVDKKVIGDMIRFKSEMFSCTISKEMDGDGWRGKGETGGGCLNEMASHAIDLVNYIIGVPQKVVGSTLSRVYSKNVDDIVSSTLIYDNGIVGTLYVNWCDSSYRKPSNKLEIFGKDGKILVDQHGMKIYLKSGSEEYNLRQGWNTIYITDIISNVPFYVRGNEFTRQLYNFVDCIDNKNISNICTFEDASLTQKVLNLIREDSDNISRNIYGNN